MDGKAMDAHGASLSGPAPQAESQQLTGWPTRTPRTPRRGEGRERREEGGGRREGGRRMFPVREERAEEELARFESRFCAARGGPDPKAPWRMRHVVLLRMRHESTSTTMRLGLEASRGYCDS